MNTKKLTASILSVAIGASLLAGFAVLPADAQTVGVTASTTVSAKVQANQATRLAKIISKSNTAITVRVADLNKLNTAVQGMKNVSATEKTNITNDVQTNITGLTNLQAKIDADTTVATAAADAKNITGSFRIYALVVPQGYIASAADRVSTIYNMMTTISAKLQTRINADQAAGKNVASLQASVTDLNAKIAAANSQGQTAQAGVASLVPDQGNATVLASNTAALKSSRADIKTATDDLQAARADMKSVIASLKSLGGNTSVTASSTVSQ
jgi:hypothetical protein